MVSQKKKIKDMVSPKKKKLELWVLKSTKNDNYSQLP